ncbi:MAG: M48 family metalloprotease [Blastocatellia bacterium]|nr:M48 family metalloprotease [Blastocatellia bacterium]
MKRRPIRLLSIGVGLSLCLTNFAPLSASRSQDRVPPPLAEIVEKSYLDVLALSEQYTFRPGDIEAFRAQLRKEKEQKLTALKQEIAALRSQIEDARRKLQELNRRGSRDDPQTAKERRDIHCQIQRLRKKLVEKEALERKTIEVAYENKEAKLDLLTRWPPEKKRIEEEIRSGRARQRPYGDVEDIGFREVGKGQEKDVKMGEEAIRELKALGLMPPEFKDEEIEAYIRNLAEYIARNSDLRVPVKTQLLLTDEVNAFALPGGFLFINTGLILEAATEGELAGVIAHEIAHAAARHSARLMKRATIASILYQAAQIAAYIATGGVVSLLTYYLLEYGFAGLGLVIELRLLGVSREFELEADQLGAQYLWKSGYDPRSFITFFDKMASKEGYARGTSFFRTHPAFADRIIHSFREFAFLPPREEYVTDSEEFHRIKERLRKLAQEAMEKQKEQERKRPRLRKEETCPEDEPPKSPNPTTSSGQLAHGRPAGVEPMGMCR